MRPHMRALQDDRRGGDIVTWTGRRVFPLDPRPVDIDIRDIARHLAFTNRWRGAIRFEFSVALHSVLVSRLAPPGFRLAGLLHDAPEAYLGELASPIKPGMPEYVAIETRLGQVVAQRFGLADLEPPEVKAIDRRIAADEALALLRHPHLISRLPEPLGVRIRHVRPERAFRMFLFRYAELTGHTRHLDRRGRAWFRLRRWLAAVGVVEDRSCA